MSIWGSSGGIRRETKQLTAVIVGDSRGVAAGNAQDYLMSTVPTSVGQDIAFTATAHPLVAANALMGWPMLIKGVFALSGSKADECISSGRLASAVALNTDVAYVWFGVNDHSAAQPTDYFMEQIDTICKAFLANGTKVLLSTDFYNGADGSTPVNFTTNPHVWQLCLAANARIRRYAALTNGVYLVDWFNVAINPTSAVNAVNASGGINLTRDSVHINTPGAIAIGEAVKTTLESIGFAAWDTHTAITEYPKPVFAQYDNSTSGWTTAGTLTTTDTQFNTGSPVAGCMRYTGNSYSYRNLGIPTPVGLAFSFRWQATNNTNGKPVIYFACTSAGAGFAIVIDHANSAVKVVSTSAWNASAETLGAFPCPQIALNGPGTYILARLDKIGTAYSTASLSLYNLFSGEVIISGLVLSIPSYATASYYGIGNGIAGAVSGLNVAGGDMVRFDDEVVWYPGGQQAQRFDPLLGAGGGAYTLTGFTGNVPTDITGNTVVTSAVTNCSVVSSLVSRAAGGNYWQMVATATAAEGGFNVDLIAMPILPGRTYVAQAEITVTPGTTAPRVYLALTRYAAFPSSNSGFAKSGMQSAAASNDVVPVEKTLTLQTPAVTFTSGMMGLAMIRIVAAAKAAGDFTLKVTKIKLIDVTDLFD